MLQFSNKVAIITGSSSGIGAAVAIALAREGAQVTIHGRNSDTLAQVAEKIKQESCQDAVQVIGEMSDENTPNRIVEATLEKFGQIDILVNNVGMGVAHDHIDAPDFMQSFDRLMNVNLRSIVNLTHLSLPHLATTHGNIVNISSIASVIPRSPIYSMTKAALDMFTKSMAAQLAEKNIRVNSVNPGPVRTQFNRAYDDDRTTWLTDEQRWKHIASVTPARYFPDGEDIAHSVLFLANDRLARNITGTILFNDSGTLIDQSCLKAMLDKPQSQ